MDFPGFLSSLGGLEVFIFADDVALGGAVSQVPPFLGALTKLLRQVNYVYLGPQDAQLKAIGFCDRQCQHIRSDLKA